MALQQSVSSSTTSRNELVFLKTVFSKPHFRVASSPSWRTPRWKGLGSLKCSITTTSFPKPSEIPWQKELCNSVNLIGIVAVPVEIKHLPSGKVVAWTCLSVKKSATQTSLINLTFWDNLALVASQHLQKGHQVHVSGRLVTDTVENEEGKTNSYYKVVAQQLNFIERNLSKVPLQDLESDGSGKCCVMWNGCNLGLVLCVLPNIFLLVSGRKVSSGTGSVVELWQAFFANPGEWWDNRMTKRNPKAPDFKHKDTGEALWIEGRYTPQWVSSQLEILDARMGSNNGHSNSMPVHMVPADEIFSF
ncbi:LOW QUALITY PROTEIN: protein OSB3, chloroplastic/mitochondrial [Vigna angularis]|uniref:LOW QUALITY PROTEIN: protein OSB3, chloroplastic/mitochondrial n=1 Tax=Phaseolus angularis TaxID=3914 RepID=UPI0022B2F66F|nr:LOW QUALITY PROTEIN: protein OSB3, chloroplastic/mitochondrial [Vigna angularis]